MDVDETQDSAVKLVEQISKVNKVPEISISISLLQTTITTQELRFTTRALRQSASYRHSLSTQILSNLISARIGDPKIAKTLLDSLNHSTTSPVSTPSDTPSLDTPEVDLFIGLLTTIYHLDQKNEKAGLQVVVSLLDSVKSLNRRTLDPIAARLFFYYSHFEDLNNNLANIQPSAVLRQDNDTQATLINIILKNYLNCNQIDQADKFVSKTTFPPTAGNNQLARFLYYQGRIKVIQLDYSAAHQHILQAIRKAPQTTATFGFQEAANKLSIIVQLLMGEIPERALFDQGALTSVLSPYLKITQVRIGNLYKFQEILTQFTTLFKRDKNLTLINRLRHNVIKAGIRRISLSYSRISLKDICLKLQLDGEEDAEYIVAKAIKDGVIDARIEHETGIMRSNEVLDIYSTLAPQQTFNERINFCLELHNLCVKALRYPRNGYLKGVGAALDDRQLALDLIDDDDDQDEDMGF